MRPHAFTVGWLFLATACFAQSSNGVAPDRTAPDRIVPGAPASDRPASEQTLPDALAAADFVRQIAASDQVEIESSRIALERGGPGQQAFAKQMIDSHEKISADLKRLVAIEKISVDLPVELGEGDRARLDKLKSMEAAKFIGEYTSLQVAKHRSAVALFEHYAKDGDNMSLKAWARRTLPALRHDLAAAEKLPRS